MSKKYPLNDLQGFQRDVIEKIMWQARWRVSWVSAIQTEPFYLGLEYLPQENVKPGYDIDMQAGEDERVWCTVFVNSDSEHVRENGKFSHSIYTPKAYADQICLYSGEMKSCAKLFIRMSEFSYVPEFAGFAPDHDDLDRKIVEVLGKRGQVIGSIGHQWSNRGYKTIYKIRFDDGTRFEALYWQIKIVGDLP